MVLIIDSWVGSLTLPGQSHTRSAIPPTVPPQCSPDSSGNKQQHYLWGGQNATDGVNVLVSILYRPTQANSDCENDSQQPTYVYCGLLKKALPYP